VQKAGVKYDCSHSGRDKLMVMGNPGGECTMPHADLR